MSCVLHVIMSVRLKLCQQTVGSLVVILSFPLDGMNVLECSREPSGEPLQGLRRGSYFCDSVGGN